MALDVSRAWGRGSTRAWRKLRADVFEAQGTRCRLAIPNVCTGLATEVHHTRGKAYGDDPAYLVVACRPCNLHVGEPKQDPKPTQRTRW